MTKEQVETILDLYGDSNISVYRTEGVRHYGDNSTSFLLWDSNNELCTNISNSNLYGNNIQVDTFSYDSITSMFIHLNSKNIKIFIDKLISKEIITQEEGDKILKSFL